MHTRAAEDKGFSLASIGEIGLAVCSSRTQLSVLYPVLSGGRKIFRKEKCYLFPQRAGRPNGQGPRGVHCAQHGDEGWGGRDTQPHFKIQSSEKPPPHTHTHRI